METGLRVLLLIARCLALGGCASLRNWLDRDEPPAEEPEQTRQPGRRRRRRTQPPPRVIEPEVERRKIKVPRIDTENFEVGGCFGALSIEDFGTQPGLWRHARPTTSPKTSSSRRKRAAPRPADQLRDPRRQHPAAYRR